MRLRKGSSVPYHPKARWVERVGVATVGLEANKMESLSRARELFDYEDWANGRVLEAFDAGDPPEDARRLFGHLMAARRVWLMRLRGELPQVDLFPVPTVRECHSLEEDLRTAWHMWLRELTPEILQSRIAYTNLKGEPFDSLAADILTQLAFHGMYHRGQIAMLLRRAGMEPPATDFILWTRRQAD